MARVLAGTVLSVLACVLLAGAMQKHEDTTATQVMYYTPPASQPNTGREGYCWVGSIADPYRADAWRCMEGNAIYDPCFSLPDQKTVVCGANPATGTHGFKLNLTKPLPENEAHPEPSDHPWPWLIKLDDGTTCMRFTGTAPFIDGQAGHYGCTSKTKGQDLLLMGDLDSANPLWTAKKATVVKSGSQWRIESSATVPVKAVWR
jgi:hypothetical protein